MSHRFIRQRQNGLNKDHEGKTDEDQSRKKVIVYYCSAFFSHCQYEYLNRSQILQ